jgi:O-antigen/teichoic acid export membrane protein
MIKAIIKNKPLFNLLIYGVGQGFNLITPLLVLPYLTDTCGQNGLGRIGIGMALSFILIVIIDYGSDIVGVKNVAVNRDNKHELSKILSTAYACRFILLAAVVAVMCLAYLFIPYFSKEKELYLLGLSILLGQCISPTWVLQGLENFKAITVITIVSKIVYVAGIFYFVQAEADYIYVNLLWGIGMILPNGAAFIYLRNKYNLSVKNTSLKEISNFLTGYFTMFSSQLFMSLQLYIPIMLIGFFIGDTMAGRYRIIDQVVVIFKTYIFLFFNYLYPRVCYLLEKNTKEAMRFWRLYNAANFAFIAVCMAVLYVMANMVVKYFTKNSVTNEALTEIAGLLRVAVFIPLAMAVSIPLKQLVLGKNYQQFYVKLTMVMVAVNIILMAVLLRYFNIYGVLASLIVTELVTALFYAMVIKREPSAVN